MITEVDFMFKSSLEICSQGYNVEQTDYYIANLEGRIAFAEKAYGDAVKRIEALEAENKILADELKVTLALISEKLEIELPENKPEPEIETVSERIEDCESSCEDCIENTSDEVIDEPDEEIFNLKSQIDELKSFFENK